MSTIQVLSPGFGTQTCEWELETRALARLRSPVLGAVHIWHYTGYPIDDDSDSDVEGTELAETLQNMTLVKTCDDGLRETCRKERSLWRK